jgi:guanine deaminase
LRIHAPSTYKIPACCDVPAASQRLPVQGRPKRGGRDLLLQGCQRTLFDEVSAVVAVTVAAQILQLQPQSQPPTLAAERSANANLDADGRTKLWRLRLPSHYRPGTPLMTKEEPGAVHMRRAIELSLDMMRSGRGGPFGAVIVKDGKIVAEGFNQVISTNDPTAHAEVVAVRLACQALGTFDLTGCEIYTSCEPCPMCLSAIYWARLGRIYYANDRHDAAKIGFRDDFLYQEIPLPFDQRTIPIQPLLRTEGWAAFEEWDRKPDKIQY